jgi:hypothetical protein
MAQGRKGRRGIGEIEIDNGRTAEQVRVIIQGIGCGGFLLFGFLVCVAGVVGWVGHKRITGNRIEGKKIKMGKGYETSRSREEEKCTYPE